MNCLEVMELMQRQLDEDLDAQEEALLDAHLEHCSECAEMRVRLKLLSSELTNLPKVVPSYSLVDAILPRLNEIDLQAAGHTPDDTHSPQQESVDIKPHGIPWTRRSRSQISWKAVGGVVAAGLIIGFFLFRTNNSLMDQADGLLQSGNNNASSAAMPTRNTDNTKDTEGSGAANPPNGDMKRDNGSSDMKSVTPAQPVDPTPKINEAPQATATPSASLRGSDKQPPAAAKKEEVNPVVPSGNPLIGKQPEASSFPAPVPTASTMEAPVEGESKGSQSEEKSTVPGPTPTTRVGPTDKTADSNKRINALRSIASIMPEETSESADGKYVAAIEQHHVLIKASDTSEVVFTSKHVWSESDKVTLQSWSEDHKLVYQVVNDTGTQTFQIDLATQTETSLKK
jgi:hypothetical protein